MKYEFDYGYFKESADYILTRAGFRPEVAIILGSTLGSLVDCIDKPITIDYKEIPNFLHTTVNTHAGKLLLGHIRGKKVVCMSGRFHFYEGYDFEQLVIPIRVLKLLGVETVIITNAAGAVNEDYAPGDIMLIKDHINFSGVSPMRGRNVEEFGNRFFDISDLYTRDLRDIAKQCADKLDCKLKEGNYFFFTGPQFETPAEIRAARMLGADAVGMSTVTETLTAAHCGMKTLAFSIITNMAAGIYDHPISGEDIKKFGVGATQRMKNLIIEIIGNIEGNTLNEKGASNGKS